VGQETFRSSENTSPKNPNGDALRLAAEADGIRAGFLATRKAYLFSRNGWRARHLGQNLVSSIRSGSFRLFFCV
jgi:hypothetical protein